MSTGYFSRTSRNTPQRNLNKSQQATQASTNPSQISNVVPEETNKGGYVYKPPSRIMRSNVNPVKQTVPQKVQKVQQKIPEVKNETLQQTAPIKNAPFVRKSQNQTPKINKPETITQTQPIQAKQQPKPINKPISRLNVNKQIVPQVKVEQKPSQQLQSNFKSTPVLDIKKPLPYSYPKKISRRGPQTQEEPQKNTNQYEQKLQQTPKFSRLQKAQQTEIHPVSSVQYQRKPLNQPPQNSQSVNNLRNSQSSIKPPIQKIQSPNSIPKLIQTPKKSLISHSSRYSNKVETPVKEQEKIEQTEAQKPQIKRSNFIAYSLHKLWRQKQLLYFQHILSFSQQLNETKKNEKLHKYFEKVTLNLCSRYEDGLKRNVFSLMKSIFSKLMKVQMTKSVDPKNLNQLISKRNQCFSRVLENITLSTLSEKKIAFSKLKNELNTYKKNKKKIILGAKVLCNTESRRLKESLKLISDWSMIRDTVKNWKLTRCSEINKSFTKQLVFHAFKNIQTFKINQKKGQIQHTQVKILPKSLANKQRQSTSIAMQSQQLNKQLKQKITQLQRKIQQLKKGPSKQTQSQELKATIQQLKQQNEAMSSQLEGKKQKNSQLKQKLDSLMSNKPFSSQEQLSSLSQNKEQNEESTLQLLHQIYMKAYKQSEEQCISEENILSLCNIHRVEENKTMRNTVAQWLAVEDNLMLKHWINLYEGNYINSENGQSQILSQRKLQIKKLVEENEIIQKFIRSYIKQRYMWEQVKQYVAAVINQ